MNRTKLTYTPAKRKSVTVVDTICFMALGVAFMLTSLFDIVLASPNQTPWLTILLGFMGLICFWLPVILSSLDD